MFRKKLNLKVERIYNEYGKLIYNIAYKLTGGKEAAEDITQETMERIIKYPQKVTELEGNELRNYIARIASNTSKNYLNKDDEANHQLELNNDIEDTFNLEDFVITSTTKEKLKEEIRKMDSKFRDPLTLHNLNGHTISAVSELIGVSERTVKYRIKEAIDILKETFVKGGRSNG